MRTALGIVVTFAWALWIGGLMATFVLVTAVFRHVTRGAFDESAPAMFHAFESYQIGLGVVALAGCLSWRVATGKDRLTIACVLLLSAFGAALFSRYSLTPRVDQLRLLSVDSSEFKEAHAQEMVVYMSATVTLMIAGIFILLGFVTLPRDRAREIALATAPRT